MRTEVSVASAASSGVKPLLRAAIAKLYADGALDDEARRRIERELDLDESRIRHAAESGASRIT